MITGWPENQQTIRASRAPRPRRPEEAFAAAGQAGPAEDRYYRAVLLFSSGLWEMGAGDAVLNALAEVMRQVRAERGAG